MELATLTLFITATQAALGDHYLKCAIYSVPPHYSSGREMKTGSLQGPESAISPAAACMDCYDQGVNRGTSSFCKVVAKTFKMLQRKMLQVRCRERQL